MGSKTEEILEAIRHEAAKPNYDEKILLELMSQYSLETTGVPSGSSEGLYDEVLSDEDKKILGRIDVKKADSTNLPIPKTKSE